MGKRNNTIRFTVSKLKSFTCPAGKPRTSWTDKGTPGLQIQVTPTGTKTFYVNYWSRKHSKPIQDRIGRFPDITIEKARKEASKRVSAIISGKDLTAERRAVKEELTLGDAFSNYLTQHLKAHAKESSVKFYKRTYNNHLEHWKNRRLSSISVQSVRKLQSKILNRDGKDDKRKQNATYAANRVLQVLNNTFNHAINNEWKGDNPAKTLKRFKEYRREVYLKPDMLKPFIESCEVERKDGNKTGADYILTALYTGVRRETVASMKWKDVNLKRKEWYLKDTKNRENYTIYLSEPVINILTERHEEGLSKEYVFPSSKRDAKIPHLSEPKTILRRIVKRSEIEIEGMNIHALKHTFVTYAYRAGNDPIITSKMGGHKVPGQTADYGHADEEEIREGYEKVASHIQRLADLKPPLKLARKKEKAA